MYFISKTINPFLYFYMNFFLKEETVYHLRITYTFHFFQLDMMIFFQTSASNTPQSVSKNATKTKTRSSGSFFNTGESTFTQTQHLMLHPDKEDQAKSIKVSILILGVVCIILFVLYVSSYAMKSNRNPVNSFTIEIVEREFELNWNCKSLQKKVLVPFYFKPTKFRIRKV